MTEDQFLRLNNLMQMRANTQWQLDNIGAMIDILADKEHPPTFYVSVNLDNGKMAKATIPNVLMQNLLKEMFNIITDDLATAQVTINKIKVLQ